MPLQPKRSIPFSTSIRAAIQGLVAVGRREKHVKIHAITGLFVTALGIYLSISLFEWISLIVCIGLVIGFEIINTAIEELTNAIYKNHDDHAKYIKDISAGAVLIMSIISIIVGYLIFYDRLVNLAIGGIS